MKIIDDFISHWPGKATMMAIPNDIIKNTEEQLETVLPVSYKYLVSAYGLVRTPNVLTKTCDLTIEIAEVHDFLSLEDVLSLSKLYVLSGMPTGYVVFASDTKGNMFCFKHNAGDYSDDSVWFYEYGSSEVSKVDDSFSQWLKLFIKAKAIRLK